MQTIDWIIGAGFIMVLATALDPLAFRKFKRKQLETCRCFYCR